MNLKYLFICILIYTLTGYTSLGQIIQTHRFEEDIKSDEKGFTVFSLKKEGLALIREKEPEERRKKKWQLEIVDTTLSKVWSTELEIESKLTLVGYEYNPKHLYLLFREGADTYIHTYSLFNVNLEEKIITTHEIKFEVDFKLSHFTMAGGSAVFGGYISNEPAVLLYDQRVTLPKVLPGLFIRQMKLLDVKANQNESFNILLLENIDKENSNLIVRTFDNKGNLIFDDIIRVDPRFVIQTGMTSVLERDELILIGTYTSGKTKPSSGFFSAVVDPFADEPLHYNDFGSMSHFLDYLPSKKAAKVKAKTQKLKRNGQLPSYSASVIPYRIEERKDGFYFLAEVYHSSSGASTNPYSYGSNYYNPSSMYGYYPYGLNSMNSNNRYYNTPYNSGNMAGNSDVQMIESVVVKLGDNGKIEKDASLKFANLRQDNLEQIGDFAVVRDSILLIYRKENEIFYKCQIGDTIDIKPIKQSKVLVKSDHEYLRGQHETEGTIRYWYGNYFYLWGYQNIKDSKKLLDKTRRVFYVNRISLE
ncbi:hypothetical protein BH09BAC3_BH09BAC3_18730 [soil metagenome]